MIEWCSEHRVSVQATPQELEDVLERGRYLVVAQELQQALGNRLNSCLSAVLHSGSVKPSAAHRNLCGTAWVAVLTSNYDGLIEGAYAATSGGILPPTFAPIGINEALECLRNDKLFLFKLHGDLNSPESIVLGNRDYARLLHQSPAYRSFLETVFAAYTVLFVGFGGSDPDLDGVIDRLSALYERSIGQHFMLVSEDQFTALERRRLLQDKRLDCILYKKDAGHSQVGEFLKALSIRTREDFDDHVVPFDRDRRRRRVFVSGSHRQIELLRQIAGLVEQAGYESWFAEKEIAVGDTIVDVISKAIDESDCMVAVVTDESAESSWVLFEIGRAWGARKKVLPIRVGNAALPSDLAGVLYLQVKSSKLTEEEAKRLLEGLNRLFGED